MHNYCASMSRPDQFRLVTSRFPSVHESYQVFLQLPGSTAHRGRALGCSCDAAENPQHQSMQAGKAEKTWENLVNSQNLCLGKGDWWGCFSCKVLPTLASALAQSSRGRPGTRGCIFPLFGPCLKLWSSEVFGHASASVEELQQVLKSIEILRKAV